MIGLVETEKKKKWTYPDHYTFKRNAGEKFSLSDGLCEVCGAIAKVIHHIDKSKDNHDLENLQALCTRCHRGKHIGEGGRRPLKFEFNGKRYALIHLASAAGISSAIAKKFFTNPQNLHVKTFLKLMEGIRKLEEETEQRLSTGVGAILKWIVDEYDVPLVSIERDLKDIDPQGRGASHGSVYAIARYGYEPKQGGRIEEILKLLVDKLKSKYKIQINQREVQMSEQNKGGPAQNMAGKPDQKMAGEDKLVKTVMSPETSFKATLLKMQNEVYECVVNLEKIEKWTEEEKERARQYLQNMNKVIHNLERLFGELQLEMEKYKPAKKNSPEKKE